MIKKHLSVVLASPADVKVERDVVELVVDEINRGIADFCGIQLDVIRWETDATPGLDFDGPQGAIDKRLRVEDRDLVIGIFWKRFGTPVANAESGTEHEIRKAVAAWEVDQKPQVFIYFSKAEFSPRGQDFAQGTLVQKFKEEFASRRGLYWEYDSVVDFERTVRRHLTDFVRDHLCRMYGTREPAEALRVYRGLKEIGITDLSFSNSGQWSRISDYQKLRERADSSILVMGVGLTIIAQFDQEVLRKSVELGLNVRLLMFDPYSVMDSLQNAAEDCTVISNSEFSAYYAREGYRDDLIKSMKSLAGFISGLWGLSGKIELRAHKRWIPVNLTAIDEMGDNIQAVAEICLPFSRERIRFGFGCVGEKSPLLDRLLALVEETWTNASVISSYSSAANSAPRAD